MLNDTMECTLMEEKECCSFDTILIGIKKPRKESGESKTLFSEDTESYEHLKPTNLFRITDMISDATLLASCSLRNRKIRKIGRLLVSYNNRVM
jgi:hypothetical protein